MPLGIFPSGSKLTCVDKSELRSHYPRNDKHTNVISYLKIKCIIMIPIQFKNFPLFSETCQ